MDRSTNGRLWLRDWLPWRALVVAVVLAAPPVLLWVSGPPTGEFPPSIITADGVLLTALVFLLGFAQAQHKSTCDRLLSELQTREETVANSHADDALPGSWWTRAAALASQNLAIADLVELDPTRRSRRARWLGTSFRLLTQFSPWSNPSPRQLERLRSRTAGLQVALRGRNRELPDLNDLRPWVAGLDRDLNAATRSLQVARLLGGGMLSLSAIGVVYAGWRLVWPPPPAAWAVAVFVVAALVYIGVMDVEMRRVSRRLAADIRNLPLSALAQADRVVPTDGVIEKVTGDDGRDGLREREALERLWRRVLDRVEQAEQQQPLLPWVHSLRGQYHLFWIKLDGGNALEPHAASSARARPAMERLEARAAGQLARAKAHLQLAIHRSHDPVAAVALACALEEECRLAGREAEPPHTIVELVDGAAADLTSPRIEGTPGRQVRWMLGQRKWLWPRDPTLHQRLYNAVHRDGDD